MKRWGYLDSKIDPLKDPIDVFAVERNYWDSFYLKPVIEPVNN